MPSPLVRRNRSTGRTASLRGPQRRSRRLSPAVLEALESRTLLTLSAVITGIAPNLTSTFTDPYAPLGGTLQIPSPTTPIDANLTNNQFESGNLAFEDAFDFDSTVPGSDHLPTLTTSTVALSVGGNAADYTFQIGPSSLPLLAGFQFTGGTGNNTLVLDYTNGDPLNGSAGVTFTAVAGTNLLKVIDPAGTYTTATYDAAAHTFAFGGQTIHVAAANLSIDLTGTKITTLNVKLPDAANTVALALASATAGSPAKLTIGSGAETDTLLYPAAASPVTLTGGNVSNALTVDLGNGNPLPPDTGAGSGLVLNTTVATTVAIQNGAVTTATLDLAANTLKLDGGLIQYPALTPVDLTSIGVTNAVLKFSTAHHAATLEQAAAAGPFRFFEAPNVTLLTFPTATSTASVVGVAGSPNALTVDYTHGASVPLGGLTFDGQATGTLTVTGTGASAALRSAAYTATAAGSGRLAIDNGTAAVPSVRAIGFTGLSPLLVTTPSIGTVSVDVTAVATGATYIATVQAVAVVPPTAPQDQVSLNLGLESITFTHPANLILGATGGDASNTYQYDLNGFSNNVTVNGNAGTLVVNALRDAAGAANTGTLAVHGGSGAATLILDTTHGDPIPAAVGGMTFQGGTSTNTLKVVNPPTPNTLTTTTLVLSGPSSANRTTLGLGGGVVAAYGLNQAIDLTAGVTSILNVQFADTTNAIGLATVAGSSRITLNGAPLVEFNPTRTTNVGLTGGAADDTLTVDFVAGNPLPTSFAFNGGAGTNALVVKNAVVTAAVVNVTAGTVVLDTTTITLTGVPKVDLSGSTVAALTLNLPAEPAAVTLSRAYLGGPAKLAYDAGSTLLYPIATNPVTLNGGAATNSLTVDLGNGNPVPTGGPGLGLFVNLTGSTNFQVVNGLVTTATLDTAAKTLAIDSGLVRFVAALPLIDLTGAAVTTAALLLSGNATLSRTTAAGAPLQIALAGVPVLVFANSTPFVNVNGAAGPNVLTLDYTHGVPLPTALLTFNAAAGALDVLVVSNAAPTTAVYTVGAAGTNTLWLDSRQVSLVNPSKVTLDATTTLTDLVVNLANTPNQVVLNSEPAPSGLNRIGLGTNDLIAFANPSHLATINGGSASDAYTLQVGFAAPLTVNDTSGVNTFTLDYSNPGTLPARPVAYHGSGNDAIVARNGAVGTVAYVATAPGAGTLTFGAGQPISFTGLAPNAAGINLNGLALTTLNVTVIDGVAHTYSVNPGNLGIDGGLTGVLFPTSAKLHLTAGAGIDTFNLDSNAADKLKIDGYTIDGGGGDDVLKLGSVFGGFTETADSSTGRTGTLNGISYTITLAGQGVPNVFGLSFRVTNANDSGLGSLRSAILNSNLYPGNTVDSNARYVIQPQTLLPTLTSQMTLNGGLMRLDGQNQIANGLQFDPGASGSTINGITLVNFSNVGLLLNGAGGSTSITGATANFNGVGVQLLNSSGVTLAETTANSNSGVGVQLVGSSRVAMSGITAYSNGVGVQIQGGSGNTLTRSFVGYNPTTTQSQAMPSPYGNKGYGVLILGGSNNTIGAARTQSAGGYDNIISGNGMAGVGILATTVGGATLTPTGNIVQNNVVGLDRGGNSQVGNLYGIYTEQVGAGNRILGNLVGGNGRYGIYLLQSSSVDVTDNTVGGVRSPNTDANRAQGNFGDGIFVNDSINITIAGNAIVGNAYPVQKKDQVFVNPNYPHPNSRRLFRQSFLANGIHLSGAGTRGTRITGNWIGLTKSGLRAPNQAFAILIDTGATYKTISGSNRFAVSNYAPQTQIYNLTKLGIRA